jgi:protein SCO1
MLAASSAAGALAASSPIAWTLRGVDGRPVGIGDLPAKWLLVYFGYTYCPDLCPTALLDMTVILRDLNRLADRVQPVFISIDPERDTAETLARYVANFAAPIIPLTGTGEEIQAAARQFHFHYVRYRDPTVADYSFDHSSSFFLVDPGHHLVADFATELPPEEIAASLRERLGSPSASNAPKQGDQR